VTMRALCSSYSFKVFSSSHGRGVEIPGHRRHSLKTEMKWERRSKTYEGETETVEQVQKRLGYVRGFDLGILVGVFVYII
jgi:hypothetical protein